MVRCGVKSTRCYPKTLMLRMSRSSASRKPVALVEQAKWPPSIAVYPLAGARMLSKNAWAAAGGVLKCARRCKIALIQRNERFGRFYQEPHEFGFVADKTGGAEALQLPDRRNVSGSLRSRDGG